MFVANILSTADTVDLTSISRLRLSMASLKYKIVNVDSTKNIGYENSCLRFLTLGNNFSFSLCSDSVNIRAMSLGPYEAVILESA